MASIKIDEGQLRKGTTVKESKDGMNVYLGGYLQGVVRETKNPETNTKGFQATHESGLLSKVYGTAEAAANLLVDYWKWRIKEHGGVNAAFVIAKGKITGKTNGGAKATPAKGSKKAAKAAEPKVKRERKPRAPKLVAPAEPAALPAEATPELTPA